MFKAATEKIRKFFEQPVNRAVDAVAVFFADSDQLSDDDKQILSLVKAVLPPDRTGQEKAFAKVRQRAERMHLSERKIAYMLEFLRRVAPGTPEEALPAIKSYDSAKKKVLLTYLLALSLEQDEYRIEAFSLVEKLADGLDIAPEEFEEMALTIRESHSQRAKIIRSGTGIVLALIVIGLFILIATWLSSLLFGLALAYLFLPLEQYLEKRIARRKSHKGGFFRRLSTLKRIREDGKYKLSEEEIQRRQQQALITKAVTVTVSCVVCAFLVILICLAVTLSSYVAPLKKNISAAAAKFVPVKQQVATPGGQTQVNSKPVIKTEVPASAAPAENVVQKEEKKTGFWIGVKRKVRSWKWVQKAFPDESVKIGNAVSAAPRDSDASGISGRLIKVLDGLKERFSKLPLIQQILTELSDYLAQGKAEKQLTELLLKKSGGLFAFIAKFVAMFATFLLNILLTFFFFSLLLGKLAGFLHSRENKDQQATSYLIRTVFNGRWLPEMSEENLQDGDRIVGEVLNKLRIWLRGYMTMVLIDYCVYTTVFTLLNVPYAPLLGAVAAVGILLPYIGPVSSALITVLVTLAVGGAEVSVLQIAGVIGIYLIHNGIIEQFFIYPWIIGESLGLTTLETIIVVLLGGILAGIPGMIFALPVASVIKYLVPQIYRCWR